MSEVMMSPNMSNEEVIEILKGMTFCCNFYRIRPKEREALDLAIKSLEERPQGGGSMENYIIEVLNR